MKPIRSRNITHTSGSYKPFPSSSHDAKVLRLPAVQSPLLAHRPPVSTSDSYQEFPRICQYSAPMTTAFRSSRRLTVTCVLYHILCIAFLNRNK
ncbi:uncharacterized protein LAJ45_04297 [Morchella importuna]|uniref:uncharacterized protein n=1 Tax=Morchella importuna TaxID=1174673 RepID=UPI001E8DB3EC|nr:uncharacterized protein LAJ45_04297 [Morchella importuna]KAH8151675.1 hypothetical protein LAJ45_04297 [Morchella importuna]